MAVKIREESLTLTGVLRMGAILTGVVPHGWVEGDRYNYLTNLIIHLTVSAYGCTFECDAVIDFSGGTDSGGSPIPDVVYSGVDMVVGGPGDTTGTYRGIRDYGIGGVALGDGTYTFSVPVDLMYDASVVTSLDGTDHGIFQTAPPINARLYYRIREGAGFTAQASLFGFVLDGSGVTTSSDEVSDSVFTDAELTVKHDSMITVLDVGIEAESGGGGSYDDGTFQITTGGGSRIKSDLSASVGYTDQAATVNTSSRPPRSFSLVAKVNSVGDDYPESIDYRCPRYGSDPIPVVTAGTSFSRNGDQAEVGWAYTVTGSSYVINSGGTHTFAPVSVSLDGGWCLAHGEYADWGFEDDFGHVIERQIFNSLIHMQGWSMPGLTLSQDAETVIDDCSTATGWAGMTHVSGGLQNTAGTATRTLTEADWSGYAWLRIHGKCASGTAIRTLTINGKTWAVPLTSTLGDVDIDLINPLTGGADSDNSDTKWPFDEASIDQTNGPNWGLSTVGSLTLSGMDAAHPDTFTRISLVTKNGGEVSVMGEWAPRTTSDMWLYRPPRELSESTITDYVSRLIVADTDGRQSLEQHGSHVAEIEGTDHTIYAQDFPSIAAVADLINSQTLGWNATVGAPADDGTINLRNGYLSRSGAAYWLMANGLMWDGTGFISGVGKELPSGGSVSFGARPLFSTLTDWPGRIGDIFEVGPTDGSAVAGTIYLVASKVLRAEAHGVMLTVAPGAGRVAGKTANLFPAPGELQTDTTAVGSGTSSADGSYRTSGAGLIGYTTASGATSGSGGVVKVGARSGTVTARSARLLRLALRVVGDSLRQWLSADRSATGKAARAQTADDGTLQVDIQADHTGATWTPKTTAIAAGHPCLRFDRRSLTQRLLVSYESGGAVHVAHSDDEAEGFTVGATVGTGWTYGTFCVTGTNAQHHFGIVSGAIKTRVLDPQYNELVAERTVVSSGVADDALAAWHNADTGDLFLQHRNGSGDIITLRSTDDGLTFA